ncbi:hypothetical protein BSZ39_12870 [Bowdeniella nasicola]|uniref:TspO and MBR related proteins n=1 Tax=Bowdeniella nasicola TaxID=208480 RepID=A0A1Q5PTX5_9ACTO|nr:TspO/MBR family protein [Bowdeniella nasicola]OKL51041.1 hypothetical protein BSZ39_12870 [Bowdeniella nasicola]
MRDEGREAEARSFAKALATNLVLNGTWSYFFFRLKSLPVSTGVVALLAMSSIDLVRRVGKTKKRRALALAPYGLWTSFASALTAEIWRRNGA